MPAKKAAPAIEETCYLPFVFSAASKDSLLSNISSLSHHLRAHGAQVNMRDLALTLCSRRSRLPFGTAICARDTEDLTRVLEERTNEANKDVEHHLSLAPSIHRSGNQVPKTKVLGIFTGQGAQSARMGADFIEKFDSCKLVIDRLEQRLARLPEGDRPSWSLKQELLRDEQTTRIGQAFLSQPLCTALQVLQVQLLRAAGIEFSAVVGHSSGEIGAAYCAGVISAEDAICIAYYRGLYSDLAGSSTGQQGAMIAVETSIEDAGDLCSDEEFKNRVSIAAINSSTSLTITGDKDAIVKMKSIFQDEGKFVRDIKVDKAYHNASHMDPCASAYICALRGLDVQPQEAVIPWFSSVDEGHLMNKWDTGLGTTYWIDNMVKPVLFMQAVQGAWKSQGSFDLVLEVGPHPALKGPTLQTIQDKATQEPPYTGLHVRGQDALQCFNKALGYIWTHSGTIDMLGYDQFLRGNADYHLVTGLPPYAWDHAKDYWHESRYSNAIRTRSEPDHQILGHLTPDSTHEDMRWRNILRPIDLPWLKDHALQGQPVFPAAGYVVSAIEAAVAMSRAREVSVSLIEILALDIAKALTFDSDDSGVETIISLTNLQQDDKAIEALFRFNASSQFDTASSVPLHASGRVRVRLGQEDKAALPLRGCMEDGLSKVEAADFYASLERLDYHYEGSFRSLSGLRRKLGFATGYITQEPSRLLLHPAVLDAAFQSLLLAHCAPNSGALWSLHVPRNIRAVRVNPYLRATGKMREVGPMAFDCMQPAGMKGFEGDVDLFFGAEGGEHAMVQIEGLQCVPFSRPIAQDDKAMFTTVVWDVAAPNASVVAYDGEATEEKLRLACLLDRMAVFFLRRLEMGIPHDHHARTDGVYQQYFQFASHTLSCLRAGKLPLCSQKWEEDTLEDLVAAYMPYMHAIDVKLLKAIGDNIVDIATGRIQAIEVGMQDNMLSQMYEYGLGFQENAIYLARLVKQIVHRFPHMDILEIGAGTGGATKLIFSEIGHTYSSYTYTDISSGFFEAAQLMFASRVDKMLYKVLDINKDVGQQGYPEHSYDLVVASAVLHASECFSFRLHCASSRGN